MFNSPFAKIKKKEEKKITFSVFYILVFTILSTLYFNSFLINDTAPNGILSFELANSLENSIAILNSWSPEAKIFAGLSLGLNFLLLLVYTLFIALIIHKLNERVWAGKPMYRVGLVLIWTMLVTAAFDGVENVSLIKLLIGNYEEYWSFVAFYFAFAKFTLIAISLVYILYSSGILLLKKLK